MKTFNLITIFCALIASAGCDQPTAPSGPSDTKTPIATEAQFNIAVDASFDQIAKGKFLEALLLLERAKKYHPDNPLVANNLAGLMLKHFEYSESRKLLENASQTSQETLIGDIAAWSAYCHLDGQLELFLFCQRHGATKPEQVAAAIPIEKEFGFTTKDSVALANLRPKDGSQTTVLSLKKIIELNLSKAQR